MSDVGFSDHPAAIFHFFLGYPAVIFFPLTKSGCDCAANWLILANSHPNLVISDQCKTGEKMFPCMRGGGHEQSSKCYDCKRFLRILVNFMSDQYRPSIVIMPKKRPIRPPYCDFGIILRSSRYIFKKCIKHPPHQLFKWNSPKTTN